MVTTTCLPGKPSRRHSAATAWRLLCQALLVWWGLSGSPACAAGESAHPSSSYFESGTEAFRRGAFGDAIADLESAVPETNGIRRCEALLALGQALYFTGQHRAALERLEKALALAQELNDRRQTAAAQGAIGNIHLAMGAFEPALRNLTEGLHIARESGYPDVAAAILNNLGNLYLARKQYATAKSSYRESVAQAEKAGNHTLAVQALVNEATAAYREGTYGAALPLLERAGQQARNSDDSYAISYCLINTGLLYAELRSRLPDQSAALTRQASDAFRAALAVAQRLNDQRTASYACGHLGRLYEDERQYPEALDLTRRAIFAAQQQNAVEALYRWHWQSGRILARQGKLDEAISAYRLALRDLQAIREEMSTCYADPAVSYRKTAAVVCFELVDLLLQRASRLQPGETADPFLADARETLEITKIYELREYFKDDCLDAARFAEKKLDVVSDRAVIVYPVLLPDRVELLVSFAGRLKRYTLPVGSAELTRETRDLRAKLMKRTTWEFLPHARKLYDWLIRPLDDDLRELKPDTLVFVPDGALRTIPLAALHDGNDFLITRYPVAVTPSLNLTDPQPFRRQQARLLSLGLTQAVQGYAGLPYVADELTALRELYPGEELLNDRFRLANVDIALKRESYSIIHIASHGQFGADTGDSFLLAYDGRLSMSRLGQAIGLFRFREEPLDLLTLSACETATGDDRAALGLAGVAVRAGARSALATLWHVNDPASYELVIEFYRQLQYSGVSRAAALRAAQLKLMYDQRYDHPGYWAPFLLINNWL